MVAVADPSRDRRRWAGAAFPGAKTFHGFQGLLEGSKPDAVLIAVPAEVQAGLAEKALSRGIATLVEKPGGRSRADAERIARACAGSSVPFAVGFNRRFMPNYRWLRAHLAAGCELTTLRGSYWLRLDPGTWDSVSGLPGKTSEQAVLLDVVPHQLDGLNWLIAEAIESVALIGSRRESEGCRLHYRVTYHSGGQIDCWASHAPGYREQVLLNWAGGRCGLYPTGHLGGPLAAPIWGQRALAVLTWLDRKWIRLGLKADVMAASFCAQWRTFARQVRGGPRDELVCGTDHLIAVHQWIDHLGDELGLRGT